MTSSPDNRECIPHAGNTTTSSILIGRQRLGLFLCNYIQLLHVASTLSTAIIPWANLHWRLTAAAVVLYVIPALIGRCIVQISPFGVTTIKTGTPDYLKWWALLNLQMVFCRFSFLEEILRVVPMLYSAWLRLWGARIGRFVYWSAGTRILDRSFLDIGNQVVFGAGVRLNPHVIARGANGDMELLLAPVRIGDRAVIGGYALLTAGTEIAADECTRACLLSPPFTRWKDGRRIRSDDTAIPGPDGGTAPGETE